MNATDTATLPGSDATKGRFEWFHNACGTIYADTEDDAIACAYHRILAHDPGHAARECVSVVRVGYNAAHGSDWQAPEPVVNVATANPALLDVAVPGATPERVTPPTFTPPVRDDTPDAVPHPGTPGAGQLLEGAPTEPPAGAPGLGATLPTAPGTPDFSGENA